MSANPYLIVEVIPPGHGLALDLGGGRSILRQPIEKLGYAYVNFDIQQFEKCEPLIVGDAHRLPFKDLSFNIVVSKDSLEHFSQPWVVIGEVHRVLKDGGQFIIWVPFMHPFHRDDFYRYSPLGLEHLLSDFEIISFESPLWVFTVVGTALIEALKRAHLGFMERPIKQSSEWLDRRFTRHQKRPASFAAAYRLVVAKRGKEMRSREKDL